MIGTKNSWVTATETFIRWMGIKFTFQKYSSPHTTLMVQKVNGKPLHYMTLIISDMYYICVTSENRSVLHLHTYNTDETVWHRTSLNPSSFINTHSCCTYLFNSITTDRAIFIYETLAKTDSHHHSNVLSHDYHMFKSITDYITGPDASHFSVSTPLAW